MNPPSCAYRSVGEQRFCATELTRGPWDAAHQHAGPPSALVCRAVEAAAQGHGLTQLSRFTANLLRPVPIGEVGTRIQVDYVGKNTGHFSGELMAQGKPVLRFSALVQRENAVELPSDLPGHPWPQAPLQPLDSPPARMPFAGRVIGYGDLIENRQASGQMFRGPCAIWFRLKHPLVDAELPTAYQRTAVAADSGNGISAVLDWQHYSFINSDLTINWLRQPRGEWICLQAQTWIGDSGCALAESALYDQAGLFGRATQSLSIRRR